MIHLHMSSGGNGLILDALRHTVGLPQYGSCWAAQIAVMAANGHCGKNPRGREMGIARKIALSPEGRAHPMFEGKPTVFDAFTSHNDEITHISPGGLHLAGSDFTSVQAVAIRHLNVSVCDEDMVLVRIEVNAG